MEVKFEVPIGQVPEALRAEAEQKARGAFILTLLRQGDISAGRAAELLAIDRWQLADLMSSSGISPFDSSTTQEEQEQEQKSPMPAPPHSSHLPIVVSNTTPISCSTGCRVRVKSRRAWFYNYAPIRQSAAARLSRPGVSPTAPEPW